MARASSHSATGITSFVGQFEIVSDMTVLDLDVDVGIRLIGKLESDTTVGRCQRDAKLVEGIE